MILFESLYKRFFIPPHKGQLPHQQGEVDQGTAAGKEEHHQGLGEKKTAKSGYYLYKKSRAEQKTTSRLGLHHFPFVRNSYAVAVGLHNLIGHYGLLEKTLVTFHSHLREIAIRAIRVHNKNWRLP